MALALSALDLVPHRADHSSADALRASVELARALDDLGYTRLWYAEHHNMRGIATTSPEILIAHIAPTTRRIRLGAGGVMLPNHAPLKVAETYRLLEALHPGRIDLGIGRAPGTDPLTALALRGSRRALQADDFLQQLGDLRGWGCDGLADDHPFARVRAIPDDVALPPLWILGSSDYGARVAAELGLGFAFAGHFSPEPAAGPMHIYRELFRPGPLERPHAMLALSVFCADSDDEARRMASSMLVSFAELRAGRPGRLVSPEQAAQHVFSPDEQAALSFFRQVQIVGTPEQVRARIEARVAETQADEVMLATHAYDPAARRRSFALLADAFGLRQASAADG